MSADTKPSFKEVDSRAPHFSEETRRRLILDGFEIYKLAGQTIEQLNKGSFQELFSLSQENMGPFFQLQSTAGEVAINPAKLYLSGSARKTFDEQINLVSSLSDIQRGQYPDTETVIGTLADYFALIKELLTRNNNSIDCFGDFIRTSTLNKDQRTMGIVKYGDHLALDYWYREFGCQRLYVAPLIKPHKNILWLRKLLGY